MFEGRHGEWKAADDGLVLGFRMVQSSSATSLKGYDIFNKDSSVMLEGINLLSP